MIPWPTSGTSSDDRVRTAIRSSTPDDLGEPWPRRRPGSGHLFAVRVEVLHPRGAEAQLAKLPGLLDLTTRRRVPYDTTMATVVLECSSAREAVSTARARVSEIGGEIELHVRRAGWADLTDVAAASGESHWSWDEVAHECTRMTQPSSRGCDPLARMMGRCRVCGYSWRHHPLGVDRADIEIDEQLDLLGQVAEIFDDAERRRAFRMWKDLFGGGERRGVDD